MRDNATAELLTRAKGEDGEAFAALCTVYEPLIGAEVSRVCSELTDTDREDVRQVALVAFYNAVCGYDMTQNEVDFGLYAKICIGNAIASHLRRERRRPLEVPLSEVAFDTAEDPAARLAEEESAELLRARIRKILSPYENRVWNLYTAGYRSGEIAKILGKDSHSVENAVYRIRTKLRAALRA